MSLMVRRVDGLLSRSTIFCLAKHCFCRASASKTGNPIAGASCSLGNSGVKTNLEAGKKNVDNIFGSTLSQVDMAST